MNVTGPETVELGNETKAAKLSMSGPGQAAIFCGHAGRPAFCPSGRGCLLVEFGMSGAS